MRHFTALLAVLLAVFFSLSHCHRWSPLPAHGEPCTVRNPARCEEPEAVEETVEPATEEDGFGPNVCKNEKMETVSVSDYVTEITLYGRYFYSSRCVASDSCSVRNITTTIFDCCEGFGARSSSRNHGFGYGRVNRHPGYRTLMTDGCTIELRESVAECLTELGLTDLIAAIAGSDSSSRLASQDEEFTVFAPLNEAFNGEFLSQMSLRTHILDEVVRNSQLRSWSVFQPLNEDTLLHVTDVHRLNRDWTFSEETFINGAQVNTSDACLAENGVVHTLNSVIPSSPDSIAELLASERQFSDFMRLLDAANVTQFLQAGRNTSRTVFAPTNAAFQKLPTGAVECLLRPENKASAQQLVLTHIISPVEYTSSLSQRGSVQTFYYYRLLVCVIDDIIHLTRDSVPLEETDMTARNGVIHSLATVLLADMIDFEELCPPDREPEQPSLPVPVDSNTPEQPEEPSLPVPVDSNTPEQPEEPSLPVPVDSNTPEQPSSLPEDPNTPDDTLNIQGPTESVSNPIPT